MIAYEGLPWVLHTQVFAFSDPGYFPFIFEILCSQSMGIEFRARDDLASNY